MANARNADFTLLDFTDEISLFPKVWDLVSGMDLFVEHNIETTVAQIEFVKESITDIAACTRGSSRNTAGTNTATVVNLNVPFYPLDRSITASEIQNFRQYGTGATPKTLLTEISRTMNRIVHSQAKLREKCLAYAIQGIGLNEGGVSTDSSYFTKFSATQTEIEVDLTDPTVNPAVVAEEARRVIIRSVQDDTGSHASYQVIAICGEQFFSNLIANVNVEEAYKYFASEQEPLRRRLGMGEEGDCVRVFRFGGITYVEDLSGNFATDEAYMFPKGVDNMFRLYYAPADDANYANTRGLPLYLWYKEDNFNRLQKIESECSMLAVNTRPELVIKLVDTPAEEE